MRTYAWIDAGLPARADNDSAAAAVSSDDAGSGRAGDDPATTCSDVTVPMGARLSSCTSCRERSGSLSLRRRDPIT